MGIVATPLGKLVSAIAVEDDIKDGDILVYDATLAVFRSQTPPSPLSAVTDVVNLGQPAGAPILASLTGGVASLRSLLAGSGIRLDWDSDTITISRVGDSPTVSETDYVIVMDADGDEVGSARLRLERGVPVGSTPVVPSPPAAFTVNDVWVDNDPVSGRGYLETRDGLDFTTTGLDDTAIVVVENTHVEDGPKFVATVNTTPGTPTVSRLEFVQSWPNLDLGGPKQGVTVTPVPAWIAAGTPSTSHDPARLYIVRAYGVDFSPTGVDWRPGETVRISGSESGLIDGIYTIWAVEPPDPAKPLPDRWSALIFDPLTPLPTAAVEGEVLGDPTAGPLTFERIGTSTATGFEVDDGGRVSATSVTVTDTTPVAPGDLVAKSWLDATVANLVDIATHNADIAALDVRLTAVEADIVDLRRRLRSTLRYWLTDLY